MVAMTFESLQPIVVMLLYLSGKWLIKNALFKWYRKFKKADI